jgi:hypothetical protein
MGIGRRRFEEGKRRRSRRQLRRRNVSDNRDHGKGSLLQLADLRLDYRDLRTGGHLAAGTAGSNHRAPAVHRHVTRAFLLGRCGGQTWQAAGQDRRHRPKQDGGNRNGHANSAHNHQLGSLVATCREFSPCKANLTHDTGLRERLAVILVTSRSGLRHLKDATTMSNRTDDWQ